MNQPTAAVKGDEGRIGTAGLRPVVNAARQWHCFDQLDKNEIQRDPDDPP